MSVRAAGGGIRVLEKPQRLKSKGGAGIIRTRSWKLKMFNENVEIDWSLAAPPHTGSQIEAWNLELILIFRSGFEFDC
ncbi:hypothetical protein L1887_22774 [Cichorium endivia]|nr:hypothetical protein L1887_22774 [Cichorium endivia]